MRRTCCLVGTVVVVAALIAGCLQFEIPGQQTLFVKGQAFVLRGTSAVVERNGPCLVWYGDNGITYHLFQGIQVANDDYDRVITPGTTARLELAARTDLKVGCQFGTVVEVQSILEIE